MALATALLVALAKALVVARWCHWRTAGTTRSRRGGSRRRGRASLEAKSWELLNGHRLLCRLLLRRRLLLSLRLNNPTPQDRCNLLCNFFRSTISKMHKRCAHFSRKEASLPCNPDLLDQVGRISIEIRHALHQVRSFGAPIQISNHHLVIHHCGQTKFWQIEEDVEIPHTVESLLRVR